MLGYTPPEPKYWKALLAVAPLAAFVSWSVVLLHIHMPTGFLIVMAVILWLASAGAMHSRISHDWRAQYGMNLSAFEHRTGVTPNVTVKKK